VPAVTREATGLARRYASALLELADAEKAVDRVDEDLQRLARLVEESDDLGRLVRSPVISRNDQMRAIAAVAEKTGAGELVRRFVGVVAANRRLFALPEMIRAFRGLLAARRGEVTAEVTSARPLAPERSAALAESLRRALGAKVAVEATVDPALLGGLVVKVGSRMIDASLSRRLERLRLAMKGVG
jgi:F-type H+-transporting ATPase subunit delta